MTERRRWGTGGITWHAASGRWMAQVRLPDGTRLTRYFPGKKPPPKPWKRDPRPVEAIQWAEKTLRDFEEGRRIDAGRTTVLDQVEAWMKARKGSWAPHTFQTYNSLLHLTGPIDDIRIDQLRPSHVEAWINGLAARDLSSHTISMVRNILSQACDMAVRDEIISRNPVKLVHGPPVRPKRERRAWTVDEAKRFLRSCEGDPMEPFWRLLLTTAMRQGEARGLKWEDVDLDHGTVMLAAALDDPGKVRGPTKTRRQVRLPMDPSLVRSLRKHRVDQHEIRLAVGPKWQDDGWVFTQPTGKPISGATVRTSLKAACARAGLEPLLPHEMRHTAVTVMHDAGVPLGTIGAIVGHTTVKMTLRHYVHVSDEELRRAVDALGRRLSG